ncbi:MAG: hypothetical protein EPO51_23370 [Phenylobacterium sp.]|uniref:hypothetical protein n=1 Tax=Phenylobacterium sp. TaxID=1871053 RepID=UPI0012226CB9|nr:hypothetical protein [Phenylobacterium sp.]TAJ69334.1 MAG: hypothetical protein EPO51_23370 [Phenylobacterium sp.]
MSGLAFWLVVAGVALAAITAATAASLDAAMNRVRPRLSILLAAVLLPAAGMILINLLRGSDPHGFGFVAMIFFGAASLPVSFAASAATIWLTRRTLSSSPRTERVR